MVVKDEIDNTMSRIACLGRLGTNHIEGVIGKYIDNSNELCTGSLSAYVSYSNMKRIKHHRMVGISEKLNGEHNLKNVIEFIDRLKEWILIFRGVATKYLNNYLGWHKFLEAVNYDNKMSSVEVVLRSISK
jgi:hypothetical protein